jgi:hypothetical protein
MGLNPRQRVRLHLMRKRRFHIVLWLIEISCRTDKFRLDVGRLRGGRVLAFATIAAAPTPSASPSVSLGLPVWFGVFAAGAVARTCCVFDGIGILIMRLACRRSCARVR